VAHVRNRYPSSTLFAAGWSLGANIMTRYLGGWGGGWVGGWVGGWGAWQRALLEAAAACLLHDPFLMLDGAFAAAVFAALEP
jgi:hypothetical protein